MQHGRKGTPRGSGITRRRALLIAGAACGVPHLPWRAAGALAHATEPGLPLHRWRGEALGARATILLQGMDPRRTEELIRRCVAEIARLENIFSLHRPASALSRLNRDGALRRPPPELVELLEQGLRFGELTDGAFDVSVQVLWTLFARHFSRPNADPAGPPEAERLRALEHVDYTSIDVTRRSIAFARPDMAVTLNGIAQGYITDRVVGLLREHGVGNVFVDLGEIHALGLHPSGRSWRVGLVDPRQPDSLARTVAITDQAVASSGGYGTRFDPGGRHHHLFDRFSGSSARYSLGVTVIARTARTADALSTALSVMPHERALGCLQPFHGARAIVTMLDGSVVHFEQSAARIRRAAATIRHIN